ncbi:MAG: radical SAM protein [Lachnospiraceae bacterium]|nr:radical SAM protein [Lachnospiraceae bacterium]
MKYSNYNLVITENVPEGKSVLCNTFSGATFLIDDEIKSLIEQKNPDLLDEDTKKALSDAGILIDDRADEARMFSYFYEKEKYDNSVLSLTLLLTMACNLRCVYCYEGAGILSNATLTDEIRDNIFAFIKDQAEWRRSKLVSLWLFGGEPLLYLKDNVKFLQEVADFCKETGRDFETHIVTNGILCNKENLEILAKYNCKSIQITLDGLPEIHNTRRIYADGRGSFDEVLQGIKNVVNDYPLCDPVIRINIDKTNYEETFKLLDFLKSENLECCYIDYGIVKGTTASCASYKGNCYCEEELGDILDSLWKKTKELGFDINTNPSRKNLFCGLYSDSSFTIAPTGDVYKCWDFVNDEKHKIGKIGAGGEFLETSFAYYDWMTRNPYDIAECRNCVYLPACGGGCVGTSYDDTHEYHAAGCYKIKGVIEKQILDKFREAVNA